MKFKNTAKAVQHDDRPNAYGFDKVPDLLYMWSRLFQNVISQAATYMLTEKFHNGDFGIFKCEGGCKVAGVNDLVLGPRSCYFDYGRGDEGEGKCADLITKVVLGWNPNDPIESMLKTAASVAGCDVEALRDAVAKGNTGPFGGDSLSSFFNYNPFGGFDPFKKGKLKKYERFCCKLVGQTDEEIDQAFSDRQKGVDLLEKMKTVIKENSQSTWPQLPLCCSPRRFQDGSLHFWVNTGITTPLDGWKTEEDINTILKEIEQGQHKTEFNL